ncbi:MAG: accessory gene regulator B family protein [Lachnospiraceae bacterium]
MKWSEYLAESLTNDGLDTDEDKEIIQFGLESLGADFLSIVLSIGIGIFFDHIMMAVLFWIWLLYGTSYYSNKGLTSTQITELYEAQAIAANTFLEYALSVYSSHSASGYRVCSSAACCQKYDPTKVTQAAISATANIFYTYGGVSKTDIVMYRPTSASYEYIWGAFFSSCGGNGTKDHATQPALRAVTCTDIDAGFGGHRYGMCQMGAASKAKAGYSASYILMHYYTGCGIISCTLN